MLIYWRRFSESIGQQLCNTLKIIIHGDAVNLEQLVAFDRIVRDGSFSRAAWSLQLAQPTISARIKTLEQTVGGALFYRNNRSVILTERGVSFLPYARQALEALQKGLDAAQLAEQGHQGELTVGVLRSVGGGFVSPAIQHYLRGYPDTGCKIVEGTHWQIVEWLHDAQIELGLVTWPPIGPQLTELTPLLQFDEPMVLLAHESHPLAKLKKVMRADVEQLSNPFLMLSFWQVTPEIVTQIEKRASFAIEVPTDTGRHLITNRFGAGFFNRSQITPELISKEVVTVEIADMPPLVRKLALVRLTRKSTLSASATHFVESIRVHGAHLIPQN